MHSLPRTRHQRANSLWSALSASVWLLHIIWDLWRNHTKVLDQRQIRFPLGVLGLYIYIYIYIAKALLEYNKKMQRICIEYFLFSKEEKSEMTASVSVISDGQIKQHQSSRWLSFNTLKENAPKKMSQRGVGLKKSDWLGEVTNGRLKRNVSESDEKFYFCVHVSFCFLRLGNEHGWPLKQPELLVAKDCFSALRAEGTMSIDHEGLWLFWCLSHKRQHDVLRRRHVNPVFIYRRRGSHAPSHTQIRSAGRAGGSERAKRWVYFQADWRSHQGQSALY